MRLLIKYGADLAARDKTHSTPLHMASSLCRSEIMRLLMDHGADVTSQNENQLTPLHLVSSWVRAIATSSSVKKKVR